MKEVWKDIPNYEGLYQVSNLGRVKRFFKNGKENILAGVKDKDGYIKIILSKNQRKRYVTAHRLVAQAFIPNPENKPEVNHKDRDKQNNVVNPDDLHGDTTNLEWVTASENSRHCELTGRKHCTRPVEQYTRDMELVAIWDSMAEAGRTLDVSSHNICSCCNRRLPTAGGFIWRYKGVSI